VKKKSKNDHNSSHKTAVADIVSVRQYNFENHVHTALKVPQEFLKSESAYAQMVKSTLQCCQVALKIKR